MGDDNMTDRPDSSGTRYRIVEPFTRITTRPSQHRTYRIGNDGSFWSKSKHGDWKRLTPGSDTNGRLRVMLGSGNANRRYIHHMVLEAFVGPCPDGLEACHCDGNPMNNRIENLRYDSHHANMLDTIQHGTSNRGERNGRAKLTADDAMSIIDRSRRGESQRSLAMAFRVGKTTINNILSGQTWPELTDRAEAILAKMS